MRHATGMLAALLLPLALAACVTAGKGQPGAQPATQTVTPPSTLHSTPQTAVTSAPAPPPAEILSNHRVRVSKDELSVELLGEIDQLAAWDLTSLLGRYPKAKRLWITSPGGKLGPALALAEVVADRHLAVYVPLFCVSACTVVLSAARERILAPGARLGYHSASAPLGDQTMAEALAASGLPAPFIARIQATPFSSMWYPSQQELLAAGAVTAVRALPAAPKLEGDPGLLIDWARLDSAELRAFAKAFPASMAEIRAAALADLAAAQPSQEALVALVQQKVSDGLDEALPRVEEPVLRLFFKSFRNLLATRFDSLPGGCLYAGGAAAVAVGMDAADAAKAGGLIAAATTQVFVAYAAHPVSFSSAAVLERMRAFSRRLWTAGVLREADVAVLEHPERNPRRVCDIVVTILDRALADPTAGDVLRGWAVQISAPAASP